MFSAHFYVKCHIVLIVLHYMNYTFFSECLDMLIYINLIHFLNCYTELCDMDIPNFIQPFIYCWAFRLFSVFQYYKECCNEYLAHVSLFMHVSISVGWRSRNGVIGT